MSFEVNDDVYCLWNGVYYTAKVTEVLAYSTRHKKTGSMSYKVHYKGWRARTDEYVHEENLLSIFEFNNNYDSATIGKKGIRANDIVRVQVLRAIF